MVENNSKYNFQKLTPVSDVTLDTYEEAIDFIFDNKDVRNVAISGAYGAGKSSLIKSYQKKHDKRFMHISLAHFKQSEEIDENEINESVLEGKILNQLIHQIPSENILQTNFRVKKKIKTKNIVLITISIMLFLLSLIHIFMFGAWSEFVSSLSVNWVKKILKITTNNYASILSGILVVVTFSSFIYSLVKAQKTRNIFRKVSLQGNEIEIFEENDESYFDKYLNEVLYLFENVDVDVIVFEDMDRFNPNRIFERLREINILVNINLEKNEEGPLRFFYLLRDDIFISKDRTKFFDFIVPVVPVIDSSNSYDQFITHFKNGEIYDLFDENFLQGLSLYIDDMRLLKNIYNEFLVYFNRLNTTELNSNKMLAIITYKNLFPRDFYELQLNQGMVFTLFANKNNFIKIELERLQKLSESKKNEIEIINNENLVSIQELNDIYNSQLNRSRGNWGEQQRVEKEYPIRKKVIADKLNNRIQDLENELSQIEHEIATIQSKQLNEIITRENIDEIFKVTSTNEIGIINTFHEIKGSEYFSLLKYLIRNGYLDETYADYMTYFYEFSLSREDKTFLRSITDKKAKEYNYKLKNPGLITERLRLVNYGQEEILNFDLFEHLLKTKTSNNFEFLNVFIQQLNKSKNFKFIGEYLNTEREIDTFVNSLNQQWPEMLTYAIETKSLSSVQIHKYSIYSLYYSNKDDLQAINIDNIFSEYISNNATFLNIEDPQIEQLINGLDKLHVSFVTLKDANINLLEEVYNKGLFEINYDNIKLMLNVFYDISNEEDIQQKNYTLILRKPKSPLEEYISLNMDTYIDIVLLSCNGIIKDDVTTVLKILNNEDISKEQKKSYIELLITSINSIIEVKDNELWDLLLSKLLVEYTEENILEFFRINESFDSTLIKFINSSDKNLNFSRLENSYSSELLGKFFDCCLVSNDLIDTKYIEILNSLGYSYNKFDIEGISNEKLKILIEHKIILMTIDNLLFIRQNYVNETLYFIKSNVNEYANIITSEISLVNEIVEILSWNIEDDIKIQLLLLTSEPISIINKNYSTLVNKHILENNLDPSEIVQLFTTYGDWDDEINNTLLQLSKVNLNLLYDDSSVFPSLLLMDLVESKDLEYDNKVDLFISILPSLNKKDYRLYLELMNLSEFLKVFEKRTRPKVEINEINFKLLQAFKECNIINNFSKDEENIGYYKIQKNKLFTN